VLSRDRLIAVSYAPEVGKPLGCGLNVQVQQTETLPERFKSVGF